MVEQRRGNLRSMVKRTLGLASISWNGQSGEDVSISSSGSHPQVDTVLKTRHFDLTFRQRGSVPKASH